MINYDVPRDAEDYVHRVGRTARAQSTGVAITFINELDQRSFKQIEDLIEKEVPKIPLPQNMVQGPVYDPTKKVFGDKQKKRGGKNFRHQRRR